MPATSFQAILDKALADYCEQIGVELDKHPFVDELRGRDSPDEVLKLLEIKANAFRAYRDGNRKLIDWLNPVVKVVHTLSGVLGEALPFKPGKAIFVGVDVLITAASGVSSSYDALVDLFECIGSFLKRLRIYTDVPLTSSMTDIIGEIMVELLSVFALATKQVKQGRFKKFAKKLLGESEIEAVLKRLNRLTQEEGRMTVAQTMKVVHGLVNNVKVVMNDGKASTEGIRNALDTMQEMASNINKIRRDLLQKESKNWLCPPDPSKNYNIGCEFHRDGTAIWFFGGSVFAEWNTKGSLLWIYGKRAFTTSPLRLFSFFKSCSGFGKNHFSVLSFLEDLVNLNIPNVHICVSGRAEIDIRNVLEPLAPLRISLHDEDGQSADISSYIDAVVHSDRKMRRWRDADKQTVINALSEKADGMFRWVFCQLEVLRRTLPAHIRSALDDMPKTLDETYERALLEIDEDMRQDAQRLFQCLSVSIRPLRVEELAEILAIRFNARDLPKFNPKWRLGSCRPAGAWGSVNLCGL